MFSLSPIWWKSLLLWYSHLFILKVMGFPYSSDGKETPHNVGDLFSIAGLGRSPGGGHGNPLQNSCLENSHGQKSLVGYIRSMGSQRVRRDWATKHSTVSHLLLAKLRLLAKIWTSMSRAIRKEVCIYWAKYCIRLFSLLLAHGIFMTTIWNRYDYSYFCKGENWGSKISWDSYPGEPISKVIRMWSLDKTSVSRAKARRR